MHKSYYNRSIYSSSITDTSAKTSDAADLSGYSKKSIIVQNGLNQNAAIQIQGSADNITFVSVGTATTVNAGVNALIGSNEVAQLVNYFPFIRATVTASVSPTTGIISIQVVASL